MLKVIQKKIDKSLSIIEQMFEVCSNPYIALSFGKDSIVMTDLIYSIRQDIPCYFITSDETFMMYDYSALLDFYKEKGWNIEILKFTPLQEANYDIDKARKIRKEHWFTEKLMQKDGVFMGLRIDESNGRRISIVKKENNGAGFRIMQYKSGKRIGQFRCCPIADWSSFEIWQYCKDNDLPLLNIYENNPDARSSARIPRAETRSEAINQIKMYNPEGYNQLISLLPELKI